MDELLEKDSQLEAAISEIEVKENLLVEKSSALEAERLRSESLANELAALRFLQQTNSSPEAQPASPPQPAAEVSLPQDRSESEPPTAIVNQHPLQATTTAVSRMELVTPDQTARTRSTSDHRDCLDPGSTSGSNTPSLASSRVSDNPSDGSPSLVFPIFRHPQHSPPSDHAKGKRGKKKPLASRGAPCSTAGP
ncbi:unnamed protein product [Cylindrotheca closterium]|uniref:Uncharacterized protein n=1 Tax=Cylindrotheca closterium TaxID=2856 RepID=A0AAD2FH91_9STRA|nr:unnamed protein product [Cylindrotheca closterium]